MGGLAMKAPVLAAFFVVATMASIGLPGLANFWGELTIFIALWKFSAWVTACAVGGIIISAVYGLRAVARIFFGPASEEFTRASERNPVTDLRWSEKTPALLLLAGLLVIGFWPRSFSTSLNETVSALYPSATVQSTNVALK
jgi:NADH-quinone oxidoreductase subunit M